MTRPPPRLLDDPTTGSDLRAALGHATVDGPSEAELAALLSRVGAQGLDSGGTGDGPGGESGPGGHGGEVLVSKAGKSLLVKIGGAVVAGGALLGGLQLASHERPAATLASARPVATVAPTKPSFDAPPAATEPSLAPEAPRPVERVPARPWSSSSAAGGAFRLPPESAAAPAAVEDSPAAETPGSTSSPDETELELLSRARREVTSNPSAALALAERHRTEFPSGRLGEEREVIAIEALARAGQLESARSRYVQFARRYGSSVHRKRLEALLGQLSE